MKKVEVKVVAMLVKLFSMLPGMGATAETRDKENNVNGSVGFMSAGKFRLSPNIVQRRISLVVLCCLLLIVLLVGFTFSLSAQVQPSEHNLTHLRPELVTVLLPDSSTFDHETKEWIFTALPLQVAYGNWQVRLQAAVIRETGTKLEHNEQEWQETLVYGDSAHDARELEDHLVLRYRNLRGELSAAERNRFEKGMQRAYARIRERDPQGATVFVVDLSAQPVEPGYPYLLDLTFEAREKTKPASARTFTVTKQVWPVTLPSSISDNSIWLRADLHLHSRYSDGGLNKHLYAVRDVFLANRGYHIAYMTDHVGQNSNDHLSRLSCVCPPHGWCTWWNIYVPHNPCDIANT